MLELFPEKGGAVTALDTRDDTEYTLTVEGPRIVTGFRKFFEINKLDVNDALVISPREDGRYTLTALPRTRKPDYRKPQVIAGLLDAIVEADTSMTEAEIRAIYQDIPPDFDLTAALVQDTRLVQHRGRWRVKQETPPLEPELPAAEPVIEVAPPKQRKDASTPRKKRAKVTPYPRGVMFPGDAGLNSEQDAADLSLPNRAREALVKFGFQVEGLAYGHLMAHAELGRRQYSVLVHVLPDEKRVDWAALLARRRDTSATYLAVFGDHRDLHRLQAPADLARATLWSWNAIARVRDLTQTVNVSPFDLESHFERDGLFEYGLERFEKTIGERIDERGTFSEVLSRLAVMKAPTIFLLEDMMMDHDVSRDQALKVLELLSQAPFQAVSKVDSGEFCLRFPVADSLLRLSEYALSLRDQLPARNRERIVAVEDADTRRETGETLKVDSNGEA